MRKRSLWPNARLRQERADHHLFHFGMLVDDVDDGLVCVARTADERVDDVVAEELVMAEAADEPDGSHR